MRGTQAARIALTICAGFAAGAVLAEPIAVTGQYGVLGEWELTASLSESPGSKKELAGPILLKHVGLCTQDGPEEKSGEMRLQLTSASRVTATMRFDGVECSFSGKKADGFSGLLTCPDRRAAPLLLWLK